MSLRMTKPTKWPARPAKTQISLGIRPVWAVIAVRFMGSQGPKVPLCGRRRLWSGWWVFADAQVIVLVLSCRGSNNVVQTINDKICWISRVISLYYSNQNDVSRTLTVRHWLPFSIQRRLIKLQFESSRSGTSRDKYNFVGFAMP